jgi:predicted CDP-diglyceride synthetase/phosphatidate cytidylyltransferase
VLAGDKICEAGERFRGLPDNIAVANRQRAGDSERSAKIQWGLMATMYGVSYAPAVLLLHIPGYEGQSLLLMLYLLLVVQISDVLQYVFGKLFGKHKLAPRPRPSKASLAEASAPP